MPTFGTGTRHEIRRLEASKTLGGQIQSLTFVDRAPPGTRFHFDDHWHPWGNLLESATNSLLYAGVQKRTVPRYQIGNRSGREYMQQTAITPGTGTIDLVFHPSQIIHREWMNAPINARYMIRSIMAPPYMNLVAGEYDHISASMVALAPEDQSIMSVEFLDSFGAEYVPGVFYRLAQIEQVADVPVDEFVTGGHPTGPFVQYDMERMANSAAITVGNATRDLPRDDQPAGTPAGAPHRYGVGRLPVGDGAIDPTAGQQKGLDAGDPFNFGPGKIRLIMKEDYTATGPQQLYIRVGDFSNPSYSSIAIDSTNPSSSRPRVAIAGRLPAYSIPPIRGQFTQRTHRNVVAVLHVPGEQGGWAISGDLNAPGKDGWLCSYEYFRDETTFGAGGGTESYNWIPLTGAASTNPECQPHRRQQLFSANLLATTRPRRCTWLSTPPAPKASSWPRENSYLF